MTEPSWNTSLPEFRIKEAAIKAAIDAGSDRFALDCYKDRAPVKGSFIAVADSDGCRVEVRVIDIIKPAGFEQVDQVQLILVPIEGDDFKPIEGRFIECDNTEENPTGWRWAP